LETQAESDYPTRHGKNEPATLNLDPHKIRSHGANISEQPRNIWTYPEKDCSPLDERKQTHRTKLESHLF